MDQVKVDIEEARLPGPAPDDVIVPDFLKKVSRFGHRRSIGLLHLAGANRSRRSGLQLHGVQRVGGQTIVE